MIITENDSINELLKQKDSLPTDVYIQRLEALLLEQNQPKNTEANQPEIPPIEFVNNLRDILFLVNEKGELEYVSDVWTDVLGWSFEETVNQPLSKFIHPDDLKDLGNRVSQIITNQLHDNQYSEFRIKTIDNNWKIFSALGKYYSKDNKHYVIGSVREVAIKTKNLIDNLSELSLVASKTQNLVLILDSDYKIRWVNDSFINRTNYKLEDVFGSEPHKILLSSINYKEDFDRIVKGVESKEPFSLNLYVNDKRGNRILVDVNVTPVIDETGEVSKFIVILADLSKLERVEKKLIEERNILQSIIDSIPSLIFVKNLKSQRILVNERDVYFQGFKSKRELIGKSDADLYPEHLAKKFIEQDEEIIQSKRPLKSYLVELERDNKDFYFQLSKFPLFNQFGDVSGVIGIGTDITELKLNEHELQRTIGIIGDQNKRLKHFTYIVSHNIRSHAANIYSLANLVCSNQETDENYHNLLKQSCGYLLETLDNLNEVLAIQENTSVERKDINILDLLNKVIDLLHSEIEETKTIIDIVIDHNETVNYNLSYLESVILNLLTNSIKYRDPAKRNKLTISYTKKQDKGVLTFSDNGLGIDLDRHQDKLFGMYQTFHQHPKAKGIGLYLVKNQIESMGGQINVESEPKKGTTFIISFSKESTN